MALRAKYTDHVWHIGETATPFEVILLDAGGVPRTDIASATFKLVTRATNGAPTTPVLIATQPTSVSSGLLSYKPSSIQMQVAAKFLAQFIATLTNGDVLPTVYVEGEIEANL